MALATMKLGDGSNVKLGRLIPAEPPRVVQLAKFLHRPQGLMGVPESIDYWSKAKASLSKMYANDRYGCCVISGKFHQVGTWTGNDLGEARSQVGTDTEVVQQYQSVCGPGDNGCYIESVLQHMKKNGLKIGGANYKIDGYVGVNARNPAMLKAAIHLFGSVTFGIDLPSAWLNTREGELWDVTSSRSVGGHDVAAVGYTKEGVVISTWGRRNIITWAALESGRYIDECYASLAPSWYNDDKLAPSGLDVEGLKKALEDFDNGILPDDPPEPGPGPTPVPPTPGTGDYQVSLMIDLPAPFSGVRIPVTGTVTATVREQADEGDELDGDMPSYTDKGGRRRAIPWELLIQLLLEYLPLILKKAAAGDEECKKLITRLPIVLKAGGKG